MDDCSGTKVSLFLKIFIADVFVGAESAQILRFGIKIAIINLISDIIKFVDGLIDFTGMQKLALIFLIAHVKQS